MFPIKNNFRYIEILTTVYLCFTHTHKKRCGNPNCQALKSINSLQWVHLRNVVNVELKEMLLTFPFLKYSIVQLGKTGFGVFCFFWFGVFFSVVDKNVMAMEHIIMPLM